MSSLWARQLAWHKCVRTLRSAGLLPSPDRPVRITTSWAICSFRSSRWERGAGLPPGTAHSAGRRSPGLATFGRAASSRLGLVARRRACRAVSCGRPAATGHADDRPASGRIGDRITGTLRRAGALSRLRNPARGRVVERRRGTRSVGAVKRTRPTGYRTRPGPRGAAVTGVCAVGVHCSTRDLRRLRVRSVSWCHQGQVERPLRHVLADRRRLRRARRPCLMADAKARRRHLR
jgi:hypothetical protein